MTRTLISATAIALVAGAAALAQDYSLDPNFGTYSLSAGFTPDPAELQVVAGGTIDASTLGYNCAGMISNAPDVRLNWSGGQITLGANSNEDTTIVVNTPDGSWACNDDTNGLNPAVTLSGSGQYDIWIGTYNGGTANATVYATEY